MAVTLDTEPAGTGQRRAALLLCLAAAMASALLLPIAPAVLPMDPPIVVPLLVMASVEVRASWASAAAA